jgi:tRNA (cytidine/uridine-2'-O-)-methyltransferase
LARGILHEKALVFQKDRRHHPPMPHLALYQPDIPQNVGAAMRLSACLGLPLDIIEPCGFPWDERKIRQSGMDYTDLAVVTRHASWEAFLSARTGRRLILLTTKGAVPYTDLAYQSDDILIAGRESAGVPDFVHAAATHRVVIPMQPGARSLNVVISSAMVLGEAVRQTSAF